MKTTVKFHLTPVGMAILKKSTSSTPGEGEERREPSCTMGGIVNWCSHDGEEHGGSSEN